MIPKVDSYLVGLVTIGVELEELIGFYGYSLEEIADDCRFIALPPSIS